MNTATPPTHAIVTTAIHASNGVALAPLTAIGARLRPITATTAPVTTGGISRSIQPVPLAMTARPISVYTSPHTTMPPSATGRFGLAPVPA